MSDIENSSSGIITDHVGDSYSSGITDSEKEELIANAFGQKQEAALEEPSTEEPKVEEEAPLEEPKEDQFAAKFAALSRKEKAIRDRESELESRLAELEGRSKEVEEKYGKYSNLGERLKNQPLDVLSEEGVDFDTLMKMVLENDGKPTTEMQIQRLRDEMENKYMKNLDNLKSELADKEAAAEEKRNNEVVEDYKYELNEFIDSNSDNYELIKLNEASDLVYQVIEEHYNENSRVLSHEEACEHVENYLLEEAKKHLNVNKIKQLLNPEPVQAQPKTEQRVAARTLSNMEASAIPNSSSQFLSDEESKREVAKLIRWQED